MRETFLYRDCFMFQKMIIDGIPNEPNTRNYFFSCPREHRRRIGYTEDFYCREHNQYCYHVCCGCLKYVCLACIRPIGHKHVDVVKIFTIDSVLLHLNAKFHWRSKEEGYVKECVSLTHKLSSSIVSTQRTIQSITDHLIEAVHQENTRLLLELHQLKQQIIYNSPTSEEVALPDMDVVSSHSNMKAKDMRQGLHPEVVKAILFLTIEENNIYKEHVYFKPNTEAMATEIGSLVTSKQQSDLVNWWWNPHWWPLKFLTCC